MASSLCLLKFSTTPTTNNVSSAFPSYKQRRQSPAIAHRYVPKVSCKAADGEGEAPSAARIDRRNVLIGLGGGLYTATGLVGADLKAIGAPISAPDLTKCGPADLPAGAQPTNCCPPTPSKIVDFKLPPPSTPLRVRPAAHIMDKAYIAKYNKALTLMKALPDDDPRSFMQQAAVHCAYCNGAYDQVGFPNLDLQVHKSWLFFPFHRYYLYFYERILGKLLGDEKFAIPYWAWDNPKGMTMPVAFTDPSSALYDKYREATHQPPTIMDLDFDEEDPNITSEQLIENNLTVVYRTMFRGGKTAELFMGLPYRAGDNADPGAGSLENEPHSPVHVWTGDSNQPNREDMGNFYSAGRDPIFYAHHANCDRCWTIWKGLGGLRKDFTDPDFLNASFLLYDENAQLVRVKVKDCLDQSKLRYDYQKIDLPWLKKKPTPRKQKGKATKPTGEVAVQTGGFPVVLDSIKKFSVQRPKLSRNTKEKEDEEEILVIQGIEVDKGILTKFDVYINDEDDAVPGPATSEFAGTFVNVPHLMKDKTMTSKTTLKLGITDILEDIDAEGDETVIVTLVPRQGKGQITVGGLQIEFGS
eukprot:TRINITY_DN21077_c0_g1_i1.p1 TRINITY_DN21077_c0_g1~~TRINITY_DN21077_c0_g1_i1.p1  ORF type:complete len:584 (-),score=50.62 TRINITY_DN21077_c0_g1_i1:261-2012(-)